MRTRSTARWPRAFTATAALAVAAALLSLAGCRCAPVPDEPVQPETRAWPLTGVPVDGADPDMRAVVVKIDNARAARPQAGLAEADIVYETLAEGGITRFTAVYHSARPERIGPVRSARAVDLDIVQQYGALFAYSGASRQMRELIAEQGVDDVGAERQSAAYTRSPDRRAPHNLYTSLDALLQAAENAGLETGGAPSALEFGDPPQAETTSATVIEIPFSTQAMVGWQWNEATSTYERSIGGEPHGDEGAASPYSAANVVVVRAQMGETGLRDGAGNPVFDIDLVGSGDATLFRDGVRYEARWSASPGSPPVFEAADGSALPLAAGRTWIQVVPPDLDVRSG